MRLKLMKLNYYTLLFFAPVLIFTGVSGFFLSDGIMSNSPSYNIFHIIFGIIGLITVLSKRVLLILGFNVVFGAIDLYQALASFMDWFPESYFQWKTADDILHIMIGIILVSMGLWGRKNSI